MEFVDGSGIDFSGPDFFQQRDSLDRCAEVLADGNDDEVDIFQRQGVERLLVGGVDYICGGYIVFYASTLWSEISAPITS